MSASTFLAEVHKLKHIQANLERNRDIEIEQVAKIQEDSAIVDAYKQMNDQRSEETAKLRNDVREMVVPLNRIRKSVRSCDILDLDSKALKKDLVEIQEKIHSVKDATKTSLADLEHEEERLVAELQVFEQKMSEWNRPASFPKIKKPTRSSCEDGPTIAKEVKEFATFVSASGGHEGGWSPSDHNLFLKTRTKFKVPNKTARNLHMMLPDISEAQVIEHDEWYQKYCELKDKQQEALKLWKKEKAEAKCQANKANKPVEVKHQSCSVLDRFVRKEEMEQKLSQWKADKMMQAQRHRQLEADLKNKRAELGKLAKQRHEEVKGKVANWKAHKMAELEATKTQKQLEEQKEKEFRATQARRLTKQFRSNDELYVRRMREIREVKSKQRSFRKPKVEGKRDPGRLLRPTRLWILRALDRNANEETIASAPPLNLRTIPKLGIPEWRRSAT